MSKYRILNFGLLAMVFAVGAVRAEVQAEFHLPFQAHWGKMTLAPGDYKISLPDRSLGVPQFSVTGEGKTRCILPLVADYNDDLLSDSSHSYLQLVKVNGTYFVSQYRSEATGKTFKFVVPKHKRHLEIADQDVVNLGVSSSR